MLKRKGPPRFFTSKSTFVFGSQTVDFASMPIIQWNNLILRSNILHTIFRNFFGPFRTGTVFYTAVQPVSTQLSPLHAFPKHAILKGAAYCYIKHIMQPSAGYDLLVHEVS
jgi:hypothetical protein